MWERSTPPIDSRDLVVAGFPTPGSEAAHPGRQPVIHVSSQDLPVSPSPGSALRRICVFCGSSRGNREEYLAAAREVGTLLARRGIGLVYGAGNVGLMGALADAGLAAGGEVVGIIPEALVGWEVAHQGLTELRIVTSMHERKAQMADLADAFIALPGGFGTLEELCEVLTWSQLGIHAKPVGLLNVGGYFDPLLALFDHAVQEGFLRPTHRSLVLEERDPARLLDLLAAYQPPPLDKWIDRDER
jgi:uncharacterized protein (TIGR00730 family)